MLKSEMYFEGRTDRFADRLDIGHEREGIRMVPRLFGLSNWKDEFVVHREGKGCDGLDET